MSEDNIENLPSIEDYKDNSDELKDIDSKIKKAQELRDQGIEAHKSGDHAKSEELLSQALSLFKS